MKLLVLDKDGTLTRTKSGHTFVQHPKDQVLIDGVVEAIAAYTADGWTMAIASNQGGVTAGHKTLEEAIAEMQYAMELTGINIAAIAHSKEENGYGEFALITPETAKEMSHGEKFRKPNAGMLNFFCHHFEVGLSAKKLMIGDRDEDFGAAVNAGFGYMHVSAWLEPFVK